MPGLSLYDQKSTFGGVYVMFMVNRIQMLYFIYIMPAFLVYPHMIWAIIVIGFLSQVNLIILSKWFASKFADKGYQGFVQLIGEPMMRFISFVGLFLILVKVSVLTLGYVEMVHQTIFPSMNPLWLILFVFVISGYLAFQGMENTVRFVVIVFLGTVWMIFIFYPFFFPPMASLHDIYPLIPSEWSMTSWKALLIIGTSFSGPEYLVFLAPWITPQPKMLKYLTLGNALSVLEYLLIYLASLFFFGSHFLGKTKFPLIDVIRYLESPVVERMEHILLSLHLFLFVFAIAILVLFFYGASRITLGRFQQPTTRFGFLTSMITIFVSLIIIHEFLWTAGAEQNTWVNLEMWLGACTYSFVPLFLLITSKLKEGV